jgi:hypothetical protein
MSESSLNASFSLEYLFAVLRRYRWYIGGLLLLTGLTAFVLTLPAFYKPEFRSETTIYPNSSERFDLINIFHAEPSTYVYGGAKEVEKLDNLASSEALKLAVIDSLNLWEAYGVDKGGASPKYEVLRTYDRNVRTIRVEGNGLSIEAYDTDPQRAADIVNLVARRVDALNQQMLSQNKAAVLALYRSSEGRLIRQMEAYNDSARQLRRQYNVLRGLTQTEVLTEQVLIAEGDLAEAEARLQEQQRRSGAASGEAAQARGEVEAQRARLRAIAEGKGNAPLNLASFREGMDQVKYFEDLADHLSYDIQNLREKMHYLEIMDSGQFPTVMMAEPAQPSDRKARPVRWVILLASLMIAGMTAVLAAVAADRLQAAAQAKRHA